MLTSMCVRVYVCVNVCACVNTKKLSSLEISIAYRSKKLEADVLSYICANFKVVNVSAK